MFMTDEVREQVERPLAIIETQVVMMEYATVRVVPDEAAERELHLRAVERLLQVVIECMADAGNALIDNLMMRDAASYVDIVDILADERVLLPETAAQARRVMNLRRALMQRFTAEEVRADVWACLALWPTLGRFVNEVRAFCDE